MTGGNEKEIEDLRELAIYKVCKHMPYLPWSKLLSKSSEMLGSFPEAPEKVAPDNLRHYLERKLVEKKGIIRRDAHKQYFVPEDVEVVVQKGLKEWEWKFEDYLKKGEYPKSERKEHSGSLLTIQKKHAERIRKGVEPLKNLLNQWRESGIPTPDTETNISYSFSVGTEIKTVEEKWFFRDLMENHSSEFKEAIEEFKEVFGKYNELLGKLDKEIDKALIKKISERNGLNISNMEPSWELLQFNGVGDGWCWIEPALKGWIKGVIERCEREECCNLKYLFRFRVGTTPDDATSYTLYAGDIPALKMSKDGVDKYFDRRPKPLEGLGGIRLIPNNNNVYTFYLDDFPVLRVSKGETGEIPLVERIKLKPSAVKFRPAEFEGFVEEFCKTVAELLSHEPFAEYAEEFWRLNSEMRESGMKILTVLEDLEGYEVLPGVCKYIYPE